MAATVASVLLGAGLLLASAGPASADVPPPGSVIDQSMDFINCQTGGPGSMGQTFTAGISGTLTSIRINLNYMSDVNGVVDVYQTDGSVPIGSPIASGSFTGAGNGYTGDVNLTYPIAIVAGTRYAFTIPASTGTWCYSGEAYGGGQAVYDGGFGYYPIDFVDLTFTTYVDPTAPVASDAAATTFADVAVDIPLTVTGYGTLLHSGGDPSHGTVTYASTTATYTPDPGFSGVDTFAYIASDGGGNSPPATVTVTVTAGILTLSSDVVQAGQDLTVTGAGFAPDADLQLVLGPGGVVLATVTTSGTGTFSQLVTIPLDTAAGPHAITVGTAASAPVTVTAPPPPPPPADPPVGPPADAPTAATPARALAVSGVDAGSAGAFGATAVGAGILLLLSAIRMRRRLR
ncbi:MAG TPA: Ig-like domain-containing protein [Pseudolysinimonas sp.]|nr:Ig-like domain-containing protein [Pseudolysinimonas sp.]